MRNLVTLFIFGFVLVGCFPSGGDPTCEMNQEMDRLVNVYVDTYEVELTPSQEACLFDFTWEFVNKDDYPAIWCGATHSCYYTEEFGARDHHTIWFDREGWDEVPDATKAWLARHEMFHHLLECMEGDPDGGHTHPGWDDGADDFFSRLNYIPFDRDKWMCDTTNMVQSMASY